MATKFFTPRRLAFTPLVVLVILAVGLVIFSMAACSSTPKAAVADPQASQAAEPVADEPVDDGTNTFGETYTWSDGVSLSISAPAPYTPTEMAAGMVEGHSAVVFEFVLTNNSDQNLEPLVYGSAASGGVEAPGVFDTSEGLSFPPTTVILPGATMKWSQAYSVLDPANITMEISPGFSYDDAIFTVGQ